MISVYSCYQTILPSKFCSYEMAEETFIGKTADINGIQLFAGGVDATCKPADKMY